MSIISGCISEEDRITYNGTNLHTKQCYDEQWKQFYDDTILTKNVYQRTVNERCSNIEQIESPKFVLKETLQKDLIKGETKGSFLLIGGSIYGYVDQNMYLVMTYFDQRVNAYKITKLNLEQMEIITIPKNETPYFRYEVVPVDVWYGKDYNNAELKPILYLQEGWTIL